MGPSANEMMMAKADRPASELESARDRLAHVTGMLEERVDAFGVDLAPVTRPSEPREDASNIRPVDPHMTPRGIELHGLLDRLFEISERLDSLRGRLEV